jgi:hypothetical protein
LAKGAKRALGGMRANETCQAYSVLSSLLRALRYHRLGRRATAQRSIFDAYAIGCE